MRKATIKLVLTFPEEMESSINTLVNVLAREVEYSSIRHHGEKCSVETEITVHKKRKTTKRD